uniref:Uncharacterized protein n=1 Tax=viral metagenome TaxID=1070528 RepID=A0A2V0RAV5_9ZZZZ
MGRNGPHGRHHQNLYLVTRVLHKNENPHMRDEDRSRGTSYQDEQDERQDRGRHHQHGKREGESTGITPDSESPSTSLHQQPQPSHSWKASPADSANELAIQTTTPNSATTGSTTRLATTGRTSITSHRGQQPTCSFLQSFRRAETYNGTVSEHQSAATL